MIQGAIEVVHDNAVAGCIYAHAGEGLRDEVVLRFPDLAVWAREELRFSAATCSMPVWATDTAAFSSRSSCCRANTRPRS